MSFIYLDIETDNSPGYNGLDFFNGRIVTVQMLLPSGKSIIIKDPTNLDNIKPILENNIVVGQSIKFDAKFLKQQFGITLRNVYDTQIAEIVISGGMYAGKADVTGLKDLVLRYCGKHMSKEEQTGFMYGVPLTMAQKEYAVNDLKYLPIIHKKQMAKIESLGLQEVINIEMGAIPAMVWLELSGISVDLEKLDLLRIKAQKTKDEAEAKLYLMLRTSKINLNSTQQLVKALNNIGIPVISTAREELIKYNHPVIDALNEYKRSEKMLNTFINKLPEYVNNTTKRVHSEYFQIGAVTGRLSCRNPNMQQQPSRGDIAKHWKEIFVADDGNEIVTADYSQIELRIVGEAARDKKYIEAYNNKLDLHRRTAAVLFKVPEDQVTKTQRSMSKSVNFGLNYGMWAGGLVKRLKADTGEDVTEQEAKQYIKDFQAMYPEVTAYLDKASKESIKNSYVRTMAGRLIRFEPAKTLKEQSAIGRLGKNNPIQGFCADLLKIAMRSIFLKLEPLGVKFVATVHDELVFECKKEQTDFVMKTVEEEMSKAGDKYFKYIPCVAEVFKAPYWHKD